ncbi:MAG: hypothetical protein NTZ90_00860 [Proteobacteria bacterium]|nr:hypothetical protein [Pseudomonadota bacterium]
MASNLPLSLSKDNKTSGFFADQACANPIPEVTIAAGSDDLVVCLVTFNR